MSGPPAQADATADLHRRVRSINLFGLWCRSERKDGKAMELKYVRHSTIGFILWPRTDDLWHSQVGQLLPRNGRIESAGFAQVDGGSVVCWGESESLKIKSREDDTDALAKQLGLQPWTATS